MYMTLCLKFKFMRTLACLCGQFHSWVSWVYFRTIIMKKMFLQPFLII